MSVSTSDLSPIKRPSRSNSISSSVITIKKSASVSSRNSSRAPYLQNRSASPDSISRVLHSLNSSRSDVRSRVEALDNKKAGAGLHMNRWSHSTSSSLSAIDADLIRKRTSSIRKSSGYATTPTSHSAQPRNSQDFKIETRGSSKRSSSASNKASPHPGSKLAFRDSSNFKVVHDSSHPTNSSSASALGGSSWEQNSGVNKFGEPIQSLSIHYTSTTRPAGSLSSTAGLSDGRNNHVKEGSWTPHSRFRDQSRSRNRETTTNPSTPSVQGHSRGNDPPQRPNPPRQDQQNSNETRSPRRRDMLSRALAKANEAVLLDNAQNVNAAIEAYNEACELLQQVMIRSADLADRRKLSSIKATYSKRIAELHDFDNTFLDLRPLPEDPPADEYENPEDFYQEDSAYQSTAINDAPAIQLPLRQESLLPEIFGGDNYIHDRSLPPVSNPLLSSRLTAPMEEQFMPAPLSPKPPLAQQPDEYAVTPTQAQMGGLAVQSETRPNDHGAAAWLEPPDGQSSKSSSRLTSVEYASNEGQLLSAIEAEFDAMNAAVDSAYDDEIDQEAYPPSIETSAAVAEGTRYDSLSGTFLDNEEEAEEQLLEDVIRDADHDDRQLTQPTVSAPPRQSDSSGFSSRTWGSSVASTTATTRTTLSTLAETIEPPVHAPPSTALPEPPYSPPGIPSAKIIPLATDSVSADKHMGLRDRRMSGQSAKQLKIETFGEKSPMPQQMRPPQTAPAVPSIEESTEPTKEVPVRTLAPAASFSSSFSAPPPSTPLLSVQHNEASVEESPATPALTQGGSTDDGTLTDISPSRHGKMMPPPPPPPPTGQMKRKQPSTSNSAKGSLSINTRHLDVDPLMTPASAVFPNDGRKPQSAITSAVTPAVSSSGANTINPMGLGGMYFLDDYVNESRGSRSPGDPVGELVPLEPCPDSFLLRPFWLMRCLYHVCAHPQGGFVSTKLFIPRDIWRVRGVKIKALDDKIAQCDLLTAALQKLAKVDTLDANAVLEELQSFETVLDQVRLVLTKKLGSDVGVPSSSSVFKSSPAAEDLADPLSAKSSNTSSTAKSFASGWRKLRSKSSSANLNPNARNDAAAQNLAMASLPMTSSSSVVTSRSYSNARHRNPPPTPTALPHMATVHAYYVSALARLFDAVQVLDGIARQVEDPGLKHSSQTHVGLEFSVRNAAEFFGFYIIRFVVSDMLMMLDKHLKKGGEWVMS